MKIKLRQDVLDTELKETIKKGTVIEREAKRGKDFLKYGEEIKEEKPKKKRAKK